MTRNDTLYIAVKVKGNAPRLILTRYAFRCDGDLPSCGLEKYYHCLLGPNGIVIIQRALEFTIWIPGTAGQG